MAITANVETTISLGGTVYQYFGTLTVTGTYTTGGVAVDVPGNTKIIDLHIQGKGMIGEWDPSTQQLLLSWDNAAATAARLPQLANGADHTPLTGVRFVAWGE